MPAIGWILHFLPVIGLDKFRVMTILQRISPSLLPLFSLAYANNQLRSQVSKPILLLAVQAASKWARPLLR